MKKNLLSILCLAALVSCTKEIEFKGEQIEPKLVINSLVDPGQPVKANISKSVFFLDTNNDTQAPDDLVATLYVNGNRIGEMTPYLDTTFTETGWYLPELNEYKIIKVYTHDYCPSEGDVVTIKASANGFDDVKGSTSALPNAVTWHFGDYQTILWNVDFEDYEGDTIWTIMGQLELTVEVTDPNLRQTDYFRILMESQNNSDYESGNIYYITTSYDDPVFGATVSNDDFIDLDIQTMPAGVFTDMLFDGKSYQIKMPIYIYVTIRDGIIPDSFSVPFSMEHLSKEYYYYLNTCEQSDEVMQFFTEPIQTYTNVEGGFGIVGGRAVDTLWFTLPLEK